jgi:cytochrome c-type biogenesis protein CcmF
MTLPIGLALLFLMAVGPALPWRKAAPGTLWARLVVPAWAGGIVVVVSVAAGVRGLVPIAAFGLGAFAFTANIRQLVLSARASRRQRAGVWRGLVGRANGGMVVHLGVVVIAVALAATTTFGHRGEVTLRAGGHAISAGHRIVFERLAHVRSPARTATEALVTVDGHGPMRPAVSQFGPGTPAVGTPAIDSSWRDDVYLTIDALPAHGPGPVTIGVTVQPLVSWLWGGGALLVVGAVLAAVPGRRRRPTDPASAPLPPLRRAGSHDDRAGPNGSSRRTVRVPSVDGAVGAVGADGEPVDETVGVGPP